MKYLFILSFVLFNLGYINSQCLNSSPHGSATAPTSGLVTFSTCSNFSQYSTLNSVTANTFYSCDITTNGYSQGYITIREGSPGGSVVAHGNCPLVWQSNSSGTYYAHWTYDASCSSPSGCRVTTCQYINSGAALAGPKTYVPDDDFEIFLETHDSLGNIVNFGDINSMGDGSFNDSVLTTNISSIDSIVISGNSINITDLTGIEDFLMLEYFKVNNQSNSITTLDFSNNIHLDNLYLATASLTSLNINSNINLTYLDIPISQLTLLDISDNINLYQLSISQSPITSFDLSSNVNLHNCSLYLPQLDSINFNNCNNLTNLTITGTQLTNLDLSNKPTLYDIYVDFNYSLSNINLNGSTNIVYCWVVENNLTTLDVNGLVNLKELNVSDQSSFTNIDLSTNTSLELFNAYFTSLAAIDFSNNPALIDAGLLVNSNLSYVDLRNGNNSNLIGFNAVYCPNLSCVLVDDTSFMYANLNNFIAVDSGTIFSIGPSIYAGVDQIFCYECDSTSNDSVVLIATGGVNYIWNNNIVNGQYFTPTSTNEYVVVGSDLNGCIEKDTATIFVGIKNCNNLSLSGLDSVIYNNQTYYQTGLDTLYHTNVSGCDSVEYITITINHTGLGEGSLKDVEVYPNPTSGIINFKGLNTLTDISHIHLLDSKGELIEELPCKESKVDISRYAPGIYFIEIRHVGGAGRIKIVKH